MISRWHSWVNQPVKSRQWHLDDIEGELAELKEAEKLLHKWSELGDLAYTVTRAHWSGYTDVKSPIRPSQQYLGYIYMIPKYSLRVLFFRKAGKKAGASTLVESVRNPRKTHKLHSIAEQNGLPKEKFQKICERQLRYWPLLP